MGCWLGATLAQCMPIACPLYLLVLPIRDRWQYIPREMTIEYHSELQLQIRTLTCNFPNADALGCSTTL